MLLIFQLLYYKMTCEPKNIYVQGMLNLGCVGGNRQKQVHPWCIFPLRLLDSLCVLFFYLFQFFSLFPPQAFFNAFHVHELRIYLPCFVLQNGALAEAIGIWKSNFDKEFEGVEECPICYSVIHTANHSLPRLACKTCKHKFHSACLYKWFSTSHKSTCPLCQSPF